MSWRPDALQAGEAFTAWTLNNITGATNCHHGNMAIASKSALRTISMLVSILRQYYMQSYTGSPV